MAKIEKYDVSSIIEIYEAFNRGGLVPAPIEDIRDYQGANIWFEAYIPSGDADTIGGPYYDVGKNLWSIPIHMGRFVYSSEFLLGDNYMKKFGDSWLQEGREGLENLLKNNSEGREMAKNLIKRQNIMAKFMHKLKGIEYKPRKEIWKQAGAMQKGSKLQITAQLNWKWFRDSTCGEEKDDFGEELFLKQVFAKDINKLYYLPANFVKSIRTNV